MVDDIAAVPAGRRAPLDALLPRLFAARSVAISTHVSADGDGCGSEAALALLLAQKGIDAVIVNPTPWPAMYSYLLDGGVRDESARGAAALAAAGRLVIVDIGTVDRMGALAPAARALPLPPLVIDHHPPGDELPGGVGVVDASACAAGELIYDIAVTAGLEITPHIATALYTALLTDTGGFRFSNTTARCLALASRLVAAGVDPEVMYRRIYASMSVGRLHLLREVLETLDVDPAGVASVAIPASALDRHGVSADELDGLAEYPRSIAGTRLALLFRDLGHGRVKVSFRSIAGIDANLLARSFGGGGHARAAGALVNGSLQDVRERVQAAARAAVAASRGD
ncbi:MAG: DHH family phosphoesterase [Gemmatimonadaceae bacterium]|nr:DHH family phosphoesterase [Gemmatimonadaceae bacterium]